MPFIQILYRDIEFKYSKHTNCMFVQNGPNVMPLQESFMLNNQKSYFDAFYF